MAVQPLPAKSCFRLGNAPARWHIMSRSHFAQNLRVCRQVVLNVTISPKVNVENRWARGSEPKGSFRGETGHGTIWKELSSWRGQENCIPWQERHASRKPERLYVRPLFSVFFWAPLMHHAFCSVQVFTDIISFNPHGFQRNKTSAWARPVACSRSNSKELWDTPF